MLPSRKHLWLLKKSVRSDAPTAPSSGALLTLALTVLVKCKRHGYGPWGTWKALYRHRFTPLPRDWDENRELSEHVVRAQAAALLANESREPFSLGVRRPETCHVLTRCVEGAPFSKEDRNPPSHRPICSAAPLLHCGRLVPHPRKTPFLPPFGSCPPWPPWPPPGPTSWGKNHLHYLVGWLSPPPHNILYFFSRFDLGVAMVDLVAMTREPLILRPLTLLIEAPERAVKHPDVPRRGCLAAGYI